MSRTIAILAGGKSSRMGADKALLRLGGITLLERTVQLAQDAAGPEARIILLGRTDAAGLPGLAGSPVHFLPDLPASDGSTTPRGPMPALACLFERTQTPEVLLLACDMPLLTPATVRRLLAAHEAAPADALATLSVVTDPAGRIHAEPAFSIYRATILPLLHRLMAESRGSFQSLLAEANVSRWQIPPESRHELLNVNTPDDFAHAEKSLLKN